MTRCLLLVLICLCSVSYGQLLTTTPAFPRDTTSFVITVDMSKGNQGLLNYASTNDVYVHIGAITNLSTSATDWRHVKFAWGSTDAAARATYIGNNRYQYTINNLRAFLGIPAGETIQKVAILFRNGTGSAVQRNSDGSDMFIPIYGSSLATKFIAPPLQPKYVPEVEPINKVVGDTLNVTFRSNNVANLTLFFNGVQISSALNSNLITGVATINASGNQQLVGHASDGTSIVSDTINFFVAPPTNVAPLPPGVRDGINYEPGDTSVVLVLHAPGKGRVGVIGDFNNWTESISYQMNRTPDGNRFWIRITGLTPGTEYGYQYLVNSSLRIADPYTQKVLDPFNDQFISASTYPNLKPYPSGKTTGIVSLLQTAEPAYNWQITNFARPDKKHLVIYELLLRDFVAEHDWKALKDTLGYLKRLGINAIELMPFNEFEGNVSWGYNPSFYFAPDKYYGTETRLKEFIDEAHRQGIAVIMDIALNHSFGQSPMVQLYWDAANNRPDPSNPWFNPVAKHAFNVGYDMNHESLATRSFTGRVIEHWLKEYKIDGFRFDLSKGFTQVNTCDPNGNNCNVGQWSAYDASRVAIWKRYYDSVQAKSQGAYVILEHFGDNTEEKELSDYGMMFWGNLNHAFNEATMGYLPNSNFQGALHTARGWNNPFLISYMESHDEERLMYKNLNFGNSSGGHNVRDLNTALKRNEMAAAFFFMMPGPKMIWQFGELGYDYSINHCQNGTVDNSCRLDPKPIRWDYLQNANRKKLYDVYSSLIKLRQHPLYRDAFGTNRETHDFGGGFKWFKLTTDTSNLLVVGNFDVTTVTGSVTFQNSGTWYNYLTGQTFNATGAAQSITLAPGEYHVYTNRNIGAAPTPVSNIPGPGEHFRLRVYPNPLTTRSTIEFEVNSSGEISLTLYNQLGQLVKTVFKGYRLKGTHKLLLGNENLKSGSYHLVLEKNGLQQVIRIIID